MWIKHRFSTLSLHLVSQVIGHIESLPGSFNVASDDSSQFVRTLNTDVHPHYIVYIAGKQAGQGLWTDGWICSFFKDATTVSVKYQLLHNLAECE